MSEILFTPLMAFPIYALLAGVLMAVGRIFAGQSRPNPAKSSPYASGEEALPSAAAPGYRPFFKVALFFAVLHLGVVVLGTSEGSTAAILYLVGLILALLALILG